MITIHEATAADFSGLGLGALAPASAEIEERAGGMFELRMTHPMDADGKWWNIAEYRVLRVNCPVRQTPLVEISGSAARMRNGRLLHHGTLLVCSNLAQMDSLLTPDAEKLQRNGVRSVKSRVANLTEFAPGLTAAHLKDLLRERFGASTCLELTPENLTQIRQRQQKFQDPAWNFSK